MLSKICVVDGCPEIRPCPIHKPTRSPSSRATSNGGYKKKRKSVIKQNPYCACGEEATEVHHIEPLSLGGTNCRENLQAVCTSCHLQIHRGTKWQT